MFSWIAIVNRGEAAMRLIHAVRDLNAEGGPPIRTIALYTDEERTAMFAREADEAYPLGPAASRPYIDLAVLERTLLACGADAVWVGWGFVAEDPAFADLCARLGVTFIGPSADAMRKLGDKIGSKLLAEEVGVPVAPWSRGGVDTLEAALAAATEIGYPLMLKATAGGGGRGIRQVDSAADLEDAYQRTRDEAERAFGSGVVFLERLVTGARHVEVQLIADSHGTAWAVGVRDCTIQRRNQKVIEESASPLLDSEQTDEVKASAERLAIAVGYVGAGTVEFLYHPGERTFAFLEVNTRLQVEHPITEVTTDLDLVKAQLHVAAGGRLEGTKPTEKGHAVEARLNAEDPDRDFAPSPGRIALLELPSGPGIRVDTGVGEGDLIPADFDSMIAKIIAYGRTREEALARLRRAMAETTVVIEGGATNKSFILDLLGQSEVIDGEAGWADTSWIDRVRAEGRLVVHEHSGIAVVAAGIEAYDDEAQVEITRLLESAHGGRPQVQHQVGRPVDFKLRGTAYAVTVLQIGPQRFRVGVAAGGVEQVVVADVDRLDEFHTRMTVGGERYRLVTATHGPVHMIEVNGVAHRVTRDEGGVLRSPAPALVVASPVAVGDLVAAGAPVLVLESMKMETAVRAPFAARVRELLVMTGSQVETGAPLVRLEPVEDDAKKEQTAAPDASAPALDLSPDVVATSPQERAARARADVAAILMGYDIDPSDEAPASASTWPPATSSSRRVVRWCTTRSSCSVCSPTWRSSAATGPPARTCTPSCGCTARRSTSTLFCRASTWSAAIFRTSSATAWRRCSSTTASPRAAGRRSWRRRCSGSSWRSSVRRPTCCWRRRSCSAGSPSHRPPRSLPAPRATCSSDWSGPRSSGSRWSATWPAAPASGGSTSHWSMPSAPASWPASATRSLPWPPIREHRTAPSGWRHWPRSRNRSCGSWPSGSRAAYPSRNRCSRCWSGATTASTTCAAWLRSPAPTARLRSLTTRSTVAPPG